MLTCAACGNTWSPASGASCPACLARGRGRDADGKLLPDPRWFSPHAPRSSGFQAWTEALRRPRFRKPKEEKRKFCKQCDEEITVGDQRSFCAPCLVEQHRDRATARYYRLKAESRCPYCTAPVSRSVVCCEDCKAKRQARPTTDRDKRMMKLSRKKLNATRKSRGQCCYCLAPNTTQYLGCPRLFDLQGGILSSTTHIWCETSAQGLHLPTAPYNIYSTRGSVARCTAPLDAGRA